MPSAKRTFQLANRLGLRPAEVADVLGISERTIRQILPELPHLRIGSAVVVPVDALRDWLRDQAQQGPDRIGAAVSEVLEAIGSPDASLPD